MHIRFDVAVYTLAIANIAAIVTSKPRVLTVEVVGLLVLESSRQRAIEVVVIDTLHSVNFEIDVEMPHTTTRAEW